MARTVYSENLFRANVGTTVVAVNVPTGVTWVIRDVSVVLRGVAYPQAIEFSIPGPIFWLYHPWASSADPFWFHEEGRWVFQQGDVIDLQMSAGNADVYLSGYVLSLP
jgi:hypothetical protein